MKKYEGIEEGGASGFLLSQIIGLQIWYYSWQLYLVHIILTLFLIGSNFTVSQINFMFLSVYLRSIQIFEFIPIQVCGIYDIGLPCISNLQNIRVRQTYYSLQLHTTTCSMQIYLYVVLSSSQLQYSVIDLQLM